MTHVYVENFGGFWKLSLEEWKAICQQGAAGEGYQLDPCKQLRNRPRWVRRSADTNHAHYWSADPDKKFVRPLDWSREEFQKELNTL